MGTGPVEGGIPPGSTSWKLAPSLAKQTQGLVVSAFAGLPVADALFFVLGRRAGGAWLDKLGRQLDISDANDQKGGRKSAAAIAFTWSGLQAIGLDTDTLATFPQPFREGMHQPDRQRRLGDLPRGGTVIPGGVRWSGNNAFDASASRTRTPLTVHVVLLVYGEDAGALDERVPPLVRRLRECGVRKVHERRLSLMRDDKEIVREHFGFADGISQPVLRGHGIQPPGGPGAAALDHWHGVAAGEVLLGHRNAHGELAPVPVVRDSIPPGPEVHLSQKGVPEGYRNLGLNGSYLVIRELYQDVAAFWDSMQHAANALGHGTTADWVAERVVGRTRDGELLQPVRTLAGNDVGFHDVDPHGLGCPMGSHIRRGNPRDSLPSRDGPRRNDRLSAANAHRILRRGRKFGPEIKDRFTNDGETRGLMFMCLNSDIARHFEFVQQNWMLNQTFATLEGETDPLLGPNSRFTIPATPLRHRPLVETFVRFAGGEYFFLPSMPALRYLAAQSATPPPL